MKDTLLELNDWGVVNAIYDEISNCKIIKPTYNKKWLSSTKIMLDKRDWLISDLSLVWIDVYDSIKINDKELYYWINKTLMKWYILDQEWKELYNVDLDETNPLKIAKWFWGWWQIVVNWTVWTNALSWTTWTKTPSTYSSTATYYKWDWVVYSSATYIAQKTCTGITPWNNQHWKPWITLPTTDLFNPYLEQDSSWAWFIRLNIPWNWFSLENDSYITFTTWALAWNTNKIIYWEWDYVYIFGTDVYWTLPSDTDKFYIFTEIRDNIVIWAKDWLHVVAITDSDPTIDKKYKLNFTLNTNNHISVKIDTTNIVLTSNTLSWFKTELDTQLDSSYETELNDWNLYLFKTDWSEIIFSELTNMIKLTFEEIFTYAAFWNIQYWWIKLRIDWNDIIVYMSEVDLYNYERIDYDTSTVDMNMAWVINADQICTLINSRLPTWYTWTVVINWEDLQFNPAWNYIELINYKSYILITKDDNSNIEYSIEPFYYYYTSWIVFTWTYTINIDWDIYTWWANNIDWPINAWWIYRANVWYWTNSSSWPYYMWLSRLDWWKINSITLTNWTNSYSLIEKTLEQLWWQKYLVTPIWNNWLDYYDINALNWYWFKPISDISIKDVVSYNWVIFAMTYKSIYHSRLKFDWNTWFYPLDYFPYKWWEKLISFGRSLLVIWNQNKIINEVQWNQRTTYSLADLEYDWNLFSRYSYLFDEWNLFILQKDKKVVQVSLIQSDKTTYSITTQELNSNLRWLFEEAEWECFLNRADWCYNFLINKDWKTINRKYDISLKAWIFNYYDYKINYISKDLVLWNLFIWHEWWYTDLWSEYKQEVNMNAWNLINFTKLFIMRTIFWINNEFELDVDLNIEYELWRWNITTQNKNINSASFDTDNSYIFDEWEIIEDDSDLYKWSIASMQETLNFSGKYIRLKYSSYNRFILWDTYFLTQSSKPLINNILNSN